MTAPTKIRKWEKTHYSTPDGEIFDSWDAAAAHQRQVDFGPELLDLLTSINIPYYISSAILADESACRRLADFLNKVLDTQNTEY